MTHPGSQTAMCIAEPTRSPQDSRSCAVFPHRLEVLEASAVRDDEVLLIFQFHGGGGSSGVPVEQSMGLLMRIVDCKVSRWRPFMSHEDALEAAGLKE
jgi:hypothetical protein